MARLRLQAAVSIVIGAAFVAGPFRAATAVRADEADVVVPTPLAVDTVASGNLAVSANGQTVYVIDGTRGAIVAVDPFEPARRREVVSAAGTDQPAPVAIGCLPGDVVAAVCRRGDDWELRTFRIRPGEPADAAHPHERMPLGVAPGPSDGVSVAVSRSRDWLAITGLPPSLPPVVRGVFAGPGVRLLPADQAASDGFRPLAATVSPADELVLLEAAGDGPVRLSFLTPSGRPLLRVDTGLGNARGLAFCRHDGRLWAVTGPAAGRPAGLWGLDAEMRHGVQAVSATRAEGLSDPLAIIDVPGESLVAIDGERPGNLLRIDIGKGDAR